MTPTDDPMPTVPDIARRAGIARSTMYRLVKEGRGPVHVKIGGSIRFREPDVAAWIARNTNHPTRQEATQ